ncbi:MAG: hypothetical protein ACOYD1_07730 [Candidatus Nanopelagicales bacterium]
MRTAVVEIFDSEDETTTRHYAKNVSWSGTSLRWIDADVEEDIADKVYDYLSVEDRGDSVLMATASGTLLVRPLDPYDGVQMSRAGVPQPLDVLEAEVLKGGGAVAQELSAVIAPDNTVVTLMLETGLGVYVRFSGDWQLLSADSTALEDTQILPVSPEALVVFDAADMANTALSAFDLPRVETLPNGAEIKITPQPVGLADQLPRSGGILVASGVSIPPINTVDDLDMAIRFGQVNPAARWYIAKRASILGAAERVPAEWSPQVVVHPF